MVLGHLPSSCLPSTKSHRSTSSSTKSAKKAPDDSCPMSSRSKLPKKQTQMPAARQKADQSNMDVGERRDGALSGASDRKSKPKPFVQCQVRRLETKSMQGSSCGERFEILPCVLDFFLQNCGEILSVEDLHFLCYIKIFIMIIVLITTSHLHVKHISNC